MENHLDTGGFHIQTLKLKCYNFCEIFIIGTKSYLVTKMSSKLQLFHFNEGAVMQSFCVFFVVNLNKILYKQ